MTSAEWTAKLAEEFAGDIGSRPALFDAIERVIFAAVSEEREACAKIADSEVDQASRMIEHRTRFDQETSGWLCRRAEAIDIADYIRARGSR